MGALDFLTTTALSATVSGNTGVAPFATLFIVGFLERTDPDLLSMDEWMEKTLSSWWGLSILGLLTILEFIGKCVPIIDEIIDSVEIFIVPVISAFGSMATFGLFSAAEENDAEEGDGRRLNTADNLLTFFKVILCFVGIFLALLIHLFKMLVRLLGEGCCTCCITTVEYTWLTISLFVAILIKPVAIVVAVILICAAIFGFMKRSKVLGGNNDDNAGGAATTANSETQQGQTQLQTEPQQSGTPSNQHQEEAVIPVATATPMPDEKKREKVVQSRDESSDIELQLSGSYNNNSDNNNADLAKDGVSTDHPDDFEPPPAEAPHNKATSSSVPKESKN